MRIITVYNSKGGVGKSTIAVCLAGYLKDKKKESVLMLDLDFRLVSKMFFKFADNPKIEVYTPKSLTEIKNIIKNNSNIDNIIIDCGGYDSELNRTALAIADVILVPASATGVEILTIKDTLQQIYKINKIDNTIIVLNRMHARAQAQVEELQEFFQKKYSINNFALVHDRSIYKRIYADFILPHKSKKITDILQSKKATAEIKELVKKIKEITDGFE